jgi:hypothetical protein
MVPTTGEALLVLLLAVLPGAMFTFGFERQAGAFGVTLADRVLRFVAVSAAFTAAYAWPVYLARSALLSGDLDAPRFGLLWGSGVLGLGIPLVCGTTIGGLYASRRTRDRWRRLRRRLSPAREARLLRAVLGPDPAPRAWDHLFSERPTAYLRVRTTAGGWLGGAFAEESYAGGFPQDGDLYLEEAWHVDEQGVFGQKALGYAVYVPAATIAYIEIVAAPDPKEDPDA